MNLARVRKLSKSKVPVFHDFIKSNVELLKNALIFVETMEYGKLVQDVIIKFNPNYHTYYSDDEKANLENFSKDEINLLITCKRISQGIDVKSIKNIILFSSSRGKLETTQRIGRCLRTNPDDPTKRATVLDFITEKKDSTDSDDRDDADENRKNWLSDLSRTRKGQTR